MSTEGNQALTGRDVPLVPSNGEGGLLGSLLKVFDSKQLKAKEFMRTFVH